MQTGEKEQTQTLETFLAALLRYCPGDLMYTGIKPQGNGLWQMTGESGRVMAVKQLALNMQGEEWCGYAKVMSISQQETGYSFELIIMLAN